MAIDLTGGLPAEREETFSARPDDPEMRDSMSFWVSDDRGEVGLPRVGIEAYAGTWDRHEYQVNVAFPDGRVYRLREAAASWAPEGPDGRPTVLGTGPLAFRCIEPFRTWTMAYAGEAVETSTQALIEASPDGRRVLLEFDVEAHMAVPPWIQGALSGEAADKLKTAVEGDFMGGPRYEQLFRATGSVRVGRERHDFTGTGLRIRRQGVRKLEGFWGHCWQSALFPSGRGFGYIAYPPRPDGTASYNEGYLFTGDGAVVPATVVEAPWLGRIQAAGEDVAVTLEAEGIGRVRIEGETVVSTFDLMLRKEMPNFPGLYQGGARYRWDGEETYGMIERSSLMEQLVFS
ncbi:MAG TPA: hypothetical protein VHX15_18780 [Frankiaceae bacterium]|jgi:hypothetical protein|nr:hypothetical protein [Frankiaceae bacterium]